MLVGYPPFFDSNPFGLYEKILLNKVRELLCSHHQNFHVYHCRPPPHSPNFHHQVVWPRNPVDPLARNLVTRLLVLVMMMTMKMKKEFNGDNDDDDGDTFGDEVFCAGR